MSQVRASPFLSAQYENSTCVCLVPVSVLPGLLMFLGFPQSLGEFQDTRLPCSISRTLSSQPVHFYIYNQSVLRRQINSVGWRCVKPDQVKEGCMKYAYGGWEIHAEFSQEIWTDWTALETCKYSVILKRILKECCLRIWTGLTWQNRDHWHASCTEGGKFCDWLSDCYRLRHDPARWNQYSVWASKELKSQRTGEARQVMCVTFRRG